ncbi:hypothetical protein ACH4F6_21645 [Streptomyces sp. NPDC017936]|uniref:hypothetical protein n=1 Tax=Streptomyces sp. NPDC017936 TaxID=3365016 RepID=UPI0037AEDBC1
MSHRGRKLAALFITLLVLGLVLNNISSRTRAAQQASGAGADPTAPVARPLSPLYVPRPASMIDSGYAGALSVESTPQDVARAFAGAYVKYDPQQTSPDSFVSGLPRLGSDAASRVGGRLPDDWEQHLSKIGGEVTVTSVSDPDPAAEEDGTAEVSVVMNTGEDSGPLRMNLALEQDEIGWVVTSVTLEGE